MTLGIQNSLFRQRTVRINYLAVSTSFLSPVFSFNFLHYFPVLFSFFLRLDKILWGSTLSGAAHVTNKTSAQGNAVELGIL